MFLAAHSFILWAQHITKTCDEPKLFQLGWRRPYGLTVYGDGRFGNRSWRDLFAAFDRTLERDAQPGANELAERFLEFAKQTWSADAQAHQWLDPCEMSKAGVIIGGYGSGHGATSFARVLLNPDASSGEEPLVVYDCAGQLFFDGCPDAVHRLIYGLDRNMLALLIGEGVIPEEHVEKAIGLVMRPNPWRAAPSPTLSLRDAIDYVHFMVTATIKYYKFLRGLPKCGGKAEIACVTSDRGFRWVTHKSLDWCVGHVDGQTEYCPVDPHGHGR
jgi:hypothetical protein